MQSLSKFVEQSAALLQDKLTSAVKSLGHDLSQWNLENQPQKHHKQVSQSVDKKKVKRSISEKGQLTGGRKSKLQEIQAEKKEILQQLKALDQQIIEIKEQKLTYSRSKKRLSRDQEEDAAQKAKQLVNHYRKQKQKNQQKRRAQTEHIIQEMKRQEQFFKQQREAQTKKLREQKHRQISLRIEECKKKRSERQYIDKQSNKLVVHLKKQKQILNKQQAIPQQIQELLQKKAQLCERKQQLDFKQIEEHEHQYLSKKQQEQETKRKRSISKPTQKYHKNMWASIIEAEENRAKQLSKVKAEQPKKVYDRRMKYGELVKSIFVATSRQKSHNTRTPEVTSEVTQSVGLPKISQSEKKISQANQIKKYRQSHRIVTSPGDHKLNRKARRRLTEKSPEQKEKQRLRDARLQELKKQTDQRLKKIDCQAYEVSSPEGKPKYRNYLGTLKLRKREKSKEWRKLLENKSIGDEEKLTKLLEHAQRLERQAKRKQQIKTEALDQESINLYVNSIQTKLAILQQF